VLDLPLALCAVQRVPVLLSYVCACREAAWLAWDFTWPLGDRWEGRRREREGNWRLGSRELMSWLGASIAPVFEDKIVAVPIGLL
jgi:hypothetical protein